MNTPLEIIVLLLVQLIVGSSGRSGRFFESTGQAEPKSFVSEATHDGVNYGCNGLERQGNHEILELYKYDGHHRVSMNRELISDLKDRLGLTTSTKTEAAATSTDLPLESIRPFSLWPAKCLTEFQFDFNSPANDAARWEAFSDAIYSNFILCVDYLRKFFGIGSNNPPMNGPISMNAGCQYYGLENVEDEDDCFDSPGCEKKSSKGSRDDYGDSDDFDDDENANDKKEPESGQSTSVTLGGGGGGGGEGSFGGFGGSSQGTAVAIDKSSAISMYICNSKGITVVFGTVPSPIPDKPTLPKYIGMEEFSIHEVFDGNKRIVYISGGEENQSKIIISTDGDASKGDLTVDGTNQNKFKGKENKDNVTKKVSNVKVGWSKSGDALLFDATGRVSKKWKLIKVSV